MAIWKKKTPSDASSSESLRCSFCNKSQRDVRKLISGPNVLICDECVDICLDIIAEDKVMEAETQDSEVGSALVQGPAVSCSFCGQRTVPVDIPKGTVMCLSCISKRGRGRDNPRR